MKFIFVDAENIGLKEVEQIESTIADKVFVFSKSNQFKEVCERKLFLCMSSYPTGPDQADFYIVGKLVGIIASLTNEQLPLCEFILYSRDNPLVLAFSFQCKLHKAKSRIALKPKSVKKLEEPKAKQTLEEQMIDLLASPASSEEVRKRLKVEKPQFTKAMNILIKQNKIERAPESKKKWVRAKCV